MALGSLGYITVTSSGTAVQCTTSRVQVQSFQAQAAPGNAGVTYVGLSGMNTGTGVNMLAVLAKPSSATTGPFASASFAIVEAPAGINLADIYIDAATNNDKVLISYAIQ